MENGIFLNDVPIDLFIKYFDSATLQDEEFNTPVYETDTNVLKVDANGNQLYRDSAGFLTTQSSYSNKFLNHQKAIRKSFAKISEDMTWMSSANKHTVVIVEKNKAENLEYYEEIETNYAYEGRVTVPDGSVIDDNRKISFETLTGGKKKETTKLPIIIQDINKLPVYTVYTSSLQNTLNTGTIFYAPEIQARYDTLKSPETNTDAHNALLNLKRRYILFDTDKAILNVQGEIKAGISRVYAKDASDSIKDSISVNLENYLVNYNSKTAQILIPWKITNSNIKNYLNRKIKIGFGTNAGMKVYEFIIKGDATSISTVKLEFVNNDGKGNFTTELISAEEIFSADQISYNTPDYYIQVIFNVTIDEDGIEHPPVVTEDAKSTIICNVQRARLADVNNQLTSGGDDNIIAGSSLSERDAPRTEYEYVKEKRYEAKTAIGKGILGFFRALFNLDEYKMVLRPKTVYNEYSADYYNITGPFKFDENIKGFTTITTTNYFRNPYYNEGSNDEYIKETITKQLEVQDDKLNLPVLQKDLPLDLKDFKNKFQLFEDSLAPVRGTYISDEVFFDKRKLRLHSMLLSFIENEEEEFNLDGEMNNSDGLVGIYNYCKGFDTDLKEASKNPILKEESNMASTLYDFDKLNYRIILENKPYTAPLSTEI